ncbi:hypothetical protein SCP_0507480 [Sparassis crispa]|uniref:Uncharacterized protein n=1 Tax=Sparassis crispa TaxID=139825 RepID=A0A401GNC1_9APHY|nr:hypothetical protein SCP_0507480 [Sparassis crispa]GBE83692.1 hypothetical protein SCP_0507480 [Sparassis crispa]
MAQTATEARLRERRNPVPLLLSSFPVPPSHIPAHPFPPITNVNPPPSLPPSSPLPPVPGPSPITEQETLSFISAARSRRTSKLSLASSTYSLRDSTATIASNASGSNCSLPSLSPSVSITPHDSSRSLRSFPSSGSLCIPSTSRFADISPVIQPRICEEDPAELTRLSLDEISIPASIPDPDLSDNEKLLEFGVLPSRRLSQSRLNTDRDLEPPVSAPATLATYRQPCPDLRKHHLDKDLPPLPSFDPPRSAPAFPSRAKRSDSPDIGDIIAATPRPRRKSASASLRSRSRSHAALKRCGSDGISAFHRSSGSSRTSRTSLAQRSRPASPTELAYLRDAADYARNDDSFVSDYGVQLDATGTPLDMLDRNEEERLDRELDGDGSDTDSSLDVHTPLPNLMLRDGLLSPNSKLLPQSSRASSPVPGGRPGSRFSVVSDASVMTKSGLYKDQRDTVQRRIRHRDGRLLRGGIGLTTGLGWSDSEDEDAPSPLTSQLLSSAHSRKSLPKSFTIPSRPSSHLARSVSAPISEPRSTYDPVSEPLPVKPRSPSTSLQRREPYGVDRRISTSSSASSASSAFGMQSRTSMSSLRSAPSLGRIKVPVPLDHINEREESNIDMSSSSNASSPLPVTPVGSEDGTQTPRKSLSDVRIRTQSGSRTPNPPSSFTNQKAVPRPLRLPQVHNSAQSSQDGGTRSSLSSSTRGHTGSLGSAQSTERPRTYSGGLQPPRTPSTPRSPPQSALSYAQRGLVAQPSASPRLSPAKPELVSQAIKPKPRTGTGMVYRTTSNKDLRPSLMRMPSSPMIRTS